jgi:hypothetical protein
VVAQEVEDARLEHTRLPVDRLDQRATLVIVEVARREEPSGGALDDRERDLELVLRRGDRQRGGAGEQRRGRHALPLLGGEVLALDLVGEEPGEELHDPAVALAQLDRSGGRGAERAERRPLRRDDRDADVADDAQLGGGGAVGPDGGDVGGRRAPLEERPPAQGVAPLDDDALRDLEVADVAGVADLLLEVLPVQDGDVRRLEPGQLAQQLEQRAGEPLEVGAPCRDGGDAGNRVELHRVGHGTSLVDGVVAPRLRNGRC